MAFNIRLGNQTIPTIAGTLNTVGGGLLTYMGSRTQADAYRSAGQASMQTARYNAQLMEVEKDKELKSLARRIGGFMSTQRAQAASAGGAVSSKSNLALMNDSLRELERQALDIRNTTKQRQDSVIYEGRIAQWQANEQAKQAEAAGRSGLFQSIGSVLTGLF